MSYLVFIIEKENKEHIGELLNNDFVSRQSITIKDAKALGIEKEQSFVIIEGSEENIKKTREIFGQKGIKESNEKEEIYKKIKKEEEEAAEGFGAIFG